LELESQQERGHKTLTDWARQMLKQVRCWLPTRAIVVVGDSSFAVLELLHAACQLVNPVHLISMALDGIANEGAKRLDRVSLSKNRLTDRTSNVSAFGIFFSQENDFVHAH